MPSNVRFPSSLFAAAAMATAALAAAPAAQAQITRGFIATHEYALPVDFKPFNIFVEYATLQRTDRAWDSSGDRNAVGKSDTIVALSKYVRLWTPDSNRNMGLAWEVIVPKVGIRDKANDSHAGGFGDPITGFAAWYKPAPQWTLGGDLFVQVPVGDTDVGGGDRWNLIGSAFWDAQYGALNYTGNLGFNLPGAPTSGPKPGRTFYTNHRFGYRVSDLVEPYVGLDGEWQDRSAANPKNNELGAALGVQFHLQPNASIAVHYQKGLRGDARAVSDNLNVRVVYVF